MSWPAVHPSFWSVSRNADVSLRFGVVLCIAHEQAHPPHPAGLLRPCGDQPSDCSTAKREYEFHLAMSIAI
jgi:hypothetical protein